MSDPTREQHAPLLEWQVIRYGDNDATRLALAYYRERGWAVDEQHANNGRLDDLLLGFRSGYREAAAALRAPVSAPETTNDQGAGLICQPIPDMAGTEPRPNYENCPKCRRYESGWPVCVKCGVGVINADLDESNKGIRGRATGGEQGAETASRELHPMRPEAQRQEQAIVRPASTHGATDAAEEVSGREAEGLSERIEHAFNAGYIAASQAIRSGSINDAWTRYVSSTFEAPHAD